MATQSATRPDDRVIRTQLLQRREKLQIATAGREPSGYLSGLIDEVDAALARLAEGTFGICETCHDPIETDRLVSDPLLRFCLDHLTTDERASLEEDLTLSARIQSALLPPDGLVCAGWEVTYRYQPAGVVSGDYCDAIPGVNELFFLIGDVSGKGVAASLLTAHLHAMFRSLITVGLPLERLFAQANRLFSESTMPNSFATLVCGRAGAGGEVEIANAGHCPPLVKRRGSAQIVEAGGLPLGLFRDGHYRTETLHLDPGDRLALYTDGLPETRNATDVEYGASRLSNLLEAQGPAGNTADVLLRDLASFRGAAPQQDDLTIMIVQRNG